SRKAESCQRMLDRLALGIEHTILQRNMHARLHFACYLHTSPGGGGRLALKAPPFNVPISSGSLFRILVHSISSAGARWSLHVTRPCHWRRSGRRFHRFSKLACPWLFIPQPS